MPQDIEQRISEEQAKIQVPTYQDVAFDGAWKRRSNSQWGLAVLGLATGVFIGAAAPLAAMAAGGAITGTLVMQSIAIYSALGMSGGWGIGSFVGSSAGAAASAMKEFERRTLAREVEEKIRENPEASVTMEEIAPARKAELGKFSDYVNIKTAILFAAIGAVAGLVFAGGLTATIVAGEAAPGIAAFAMPAMKTLLGAAASNMAAVTAYTVGVGAAFGAIFGVNYPRLALDLSNGFGGLLSGKSINAEWPKSANLPELKPVLGPVVHEPEAPAKTFTDKVERKPNYEALVTQAIKEADCGCTRT